MVTRSTAVDHTKCTSYWDVVRTLWTQQEKSLILSTDRTSGLGLTYVEIYEDNTSPLARNGWLLSYLYLLARLDIVFDIATIQSPQRSNNVADLDFLGAWREALVLDGSTISALRATLSSAPPELDDNSFGVFLLHVDLYIKVGPLAPFLG